MEDLVGRYKSYNKRVRFSYGELKESEHLLLTYTQWEALSKEKKCGEGSSGGAKNRDHGGGHDKVGSDHDNDNNNASVNSDDNKCKSVRKKGKYYNYNI
ncbi:hypothetical protein E2562_021140 [Oryza meyeriana var. granulata]|uniref:Uncharacterized protein n=1 Tax=Oryza meyeriana var. granulata TaxID=110450 RepID=A0A6G1BM27_9ORYZ|nr:hypothetical protein E2562_021140 [Oryza meyeriana var. granulata]